MAEILEVIHGKGGLADAAEQRQHVSPESIATGDEVGRQADAFVSIVCQRFSQFPRGFLRRDGF